MKEKRDILFLCQFFYPEYVSSATLPYDTAKALVKAGLSVSALCGYPIEYNKDGKVPTEEVYEGIRIKRLKYLQFKRSNFLGRLINYFSFTFAVFLRFFSLRNYKTIIVYSNPPMLPLIAAWANKCFKTKMIFVCYDVYPEIAYITKSINRNGLIDNLMRFINHRIYRYVDRVVALSNEMKQYLLDHRENLSPDQVIVIPNWYEDRPLVDTFISYSNKKFKCLDSENNFVVSYFGNMGICQDLNTILDAIRELKGNDKIKFLFAGHGNKMNQLKNIVEEERLINVTIYDFLHSKDFQDALNISDCFLVSLAEGLTGLAVPSKTYSYMMAGKPVIAIIGVNSDISKDLIENEAGYSIEVGDVEKLVSSVCKLKNDRQLREKMGTNIRGVFREKYTTSKCTRQYIELMNHILEA